MSQISHNKIELQAIDWLRKQGWKILNEGKIEEILCSVKLENIPYKSHLLIERNGYIFFVSVFNKEDYFWSKTHQCDVTGMDIWKYRFLQAVGDLTKVYSAVLFHNEQLDEFIFRQISELPIPWKWRSSYCLAKGYGRKEEFLNCFQCWKNNPQTTRNCIHRKTKTRPMVVWDKDLFQLNTDFQINLFNHGFIKNKKSGRTVIRSNR